MTDTRLYESDDELEAIEISAIEAKRLARQQAFINAENTFKMTTEKFENAQTRAELARQKLAEAITGADGETYIIYDKLYKDAQNEAFELQRSIEEQKAVYQRAVSTREWEGDESVSKRAQSFAQKHNLDDKTIQKMHAKANALINQGFDPRTTRYWRELEKHIPDTNSDDDEVYKERSTKQKTIKFVLTSEHKKALDMMGIDDYNSPEAKRYIKRWAEWRPGDSDMVDVGR